MEEARKAYQSVEHCRKWISAAADRMKEESRTRGEENDTVTRIRKFVEENLENRISREMIAEQLYFSTDYISRIFKKETGQSLSEYIMLRKIERARELVAEGKDNIGDIAVKLGYNNFSYFSEIFRRVTGYLPSDYRKRKGEQNSGKRTEKVIRKTAKWTKMKKQWKTEPLLFRFSGKRKTDFCEKKRLRQSIMESSNITAYKTKGEKQYENEKNSGTDRSSCNGTDFTASNRYHRFCR